MIFGVNILGKIKVQWLLVINKYTSLYVFFVLFGSCVNTIENRNIQQLPNANTQFK